MRIFLAAAALAAAFTAVPAAAQQIVYTIAGTGSGSLGGTAFSNSAFTFTLRGDLANFTDNAFSAILNPLDSAVVSIDGFADATILIPTRIGLNKGNNAVFFSRSSGLDLFDFFVQSGLDIGAAFGPIPGTNVFALDQFVDIDTTGGALTFRQSSDVRFSASTGVVVPEPATWAMFILGFGAVGLVARRRRRSVAHA